MRRLALSFILIFCWSNCFASDMICSLPPDNTFFGGTTYITLKEKTDPVNGAKSTIIEYFNSSSLKEYNDLISLNNKRSISMALDIDETRNRMLRDQSLFEHLLGTKNVPEFDELNNELNCRVNSYEAEKVKLNKYFKGLLKNANKIQVEALSKNQSEWELFCDNTCALEYSILGNGNNSEVLNACLLRMTKERKSTLTNISIGMISNTASQ